MKVNKVILVRNQFSITKVNSPKKRKSLITIKFNKDLTCLYPNSKTMHSNKSPKQSSKLKSRPKTKKSKKVCLPKKR